MHTWSVKVEGGPRHVGEAFASVTATDLTNGTHLSTSRTVILKTKEAEEPEF
jgi:hypothetical protein